MWAIESVFETVAEWEAAFAHVEAMIPSIAPFRGRLGESGAMLWEAMEAATALFTAFDPVMLYARMLAAGDAGDQAAAGMTGRVSGLMARCFAAVSYFGPEILGIPEDRLESFFHDDPRLATYRHAIDKWTRPFAEDDDRPLFSPPGP
jgi:oligoendopeptidase F